MKTLLCTAPLLSAPQPLKQFQIFVGVGSVLMQENNLDIDIPAFLFFPLYLGCSVPLIVYADYNPRNFLLPSYISLQYQSWLVAVFQINLVKLL